MVKLRFLPHTLKDNAKKWVYGLPTNSIYNWNDFTKAFLQKYFSNDRTV